MQDLGFNSQHWGKKNCLILLCTQLIELLKFLQRTKKENLELSDEHQSNQENVYRIEKQKTCRYCNKSDSIFWYEPDLCHRCHVLRVSGDENVLESSKKSEINTLLHNIPDEVKDDLLKDIDSSVVHLK